MHPPLDEAELDRDEPMTIVINITTAPPSRRI